MNVTKLVLGAFVALSLSNVASAQSTFLDDARLINCGDSYNSRIELRKADNGDLSIKLEGLNDRRCNTLSFVDSSSQRIIKSYDVNGSSFTLSQAQRSALSSDCKVDIVFTNGTYTQRNQPQESFYITLGWWCDGSSVRPVKRPNNYSFQWSNNNNCKLLINGQYEKNVQDKFCRAAAGKDVITYEVSNAGNCKLMINGKYSNENVSDYYCNVKL